MEWIKPFPEFIKAFYWFMKHRPELVHDVATGWTGLVAPLIDEWGQ
jgi:hypothetical protein